MLDRYYKTIEEQCKRNQARNNRATMQYARLRHEARPSEQRVMYGPVASLISQHLLNPRRFVLDQFGYDFARDRLGLPFALAQQVMRAAQARAIKSAKAADPDCT